MNILWCIVNTVCVVHTEHSVRIMNIVWCVVQKVRDMFFEALAIDKNSIYMSSVLYKLQFRAADAFAMVKTLSEKKDAAQDALAKLGGCCCAVFIGPQRGSF